MTLWMMCVYSFVGDFQLFSFWKGYFNQKNRLNDEILVFGIHINYSLDKHVQAVEAEKKCVGKFCPFLFLINNSCVHVTDDMASDLLCMCHSLIMSNLWKPFLNNTNTI